FMKAHIRGDDPRPPDVLWHYTDVTGLKGIIESDSLHFTDARFLNDTSEMKHGRMVYLEVLENALGVECGARLSLVQSLRSSVDDEGSGGSYVACFCTEGSLLSQWRTYGATGNGFSLGFDTTSTHWRESETGSG